MSKQLVLGIEGGATRTLWALVAGGNVIREGILGPGSCRLLDDEALGALFGTLPDAESVGVCLAGCATDSDRQRIGCLARGRWPESAIRVGSDRESGFAAEFGDGDGIVVIAGTGSAVTGRRGSVEDRAGGWGHLLGDTGGGYDLAVQALRRVLTDFDTARRITPFARDVLAALGLNTLHELTTWAQQAHKDALARLTPIVFDHASDPEMQAIIESAAQALAALAVAVARRLDMKAPEIRMTGGVFARQELYRELFAVALRREIPSAAIAPGTRPGSHGAVFLATGRHPSRVEEAVEPALSLADTEQTNPRSKDLSRLSSAEIATLFIDEEHHVEDALRAVAGKLGEGIERLAESIRGGGRVFYVGAGTSGRLGMLDASEMPPTFGVPHTMFQAILAGGAGAFHRAVEGAEDSAEAGALAIASRGVAAGDAVCGIAASGRTPFVLGALQRAKAIGARTIFLTCNPSRNRIVPIADIEIDLPTGPELITGSTRLKAGTATKAALNILSAGAMVRVGRVDGNLMTCLEPTNAKLRDRAVRIVSTRRGIPHSRARELLECANWDIRTALESNGARPDR